MNLPEDLKNIQVHLDSETARQIADQYITFRYVEHFTLTFICALLFIGLPIWITLMLVRSKRRSDENHKKAMDDIINRKEKH